MSRSPDWTDSLSAEEIADIVDTRGGEVAARYGAESLNGAAPLGSPRFHLLTLADLESLPELTYLIDGLLPEAGNAMLYGPSGEGKSFLALDWALSIAARQPTWQGRKVLVPGLVVYIAAEGLGSLKRRAGAWMRANQVTDTPEIRFIGEAIQLLELADANGLVYAIEAVTDRELPRLIVVDTLARCLVGADENAVKDVSRAIASVDYLRQQTGASVLLVHHSQKAGDLERGSSALRAAMDVMLSLRAEEGTLILESTKVRDGPAVERISLVLQPLADSCVIVSQDTAPTPTGLTRKQRECLEAFDRVAIEGAAPVTVWSKSAAIAERSFYRLVKQLVDGGYIEKRRGVGYLLTLTGRAALLPTANLLPTTATDSDYCQLPSTATPRRGGSAFGSGSEPEHGDAWEPEEPL